MPTTTGASRPADGVPPPAVRLAHRWATALADGDQSHGTAAELTAELVPLVVRLARFIGSDQPDDLLARDICDVLTSRGRTPAAVVGPSVRTLFDRLVDDLREPRDQQGAARHRGAAITARVAELLAEATRTRTLAAQEELQRAALGAVRTAEDRRHTSDSRFSALFSQAAAGIGILSSAGTVIDANATWSEQMGYPIEEMRGRTIAELVSPKTEVRAMNRLEELLAGTRNDFRLEFDHVRHDGRPYVLDLSVSRVHTAGAEPDFLVGIAIDVTERRQLQERLWHEARHDSLTGLPNRTMFFEQLGALLAAPHRPPLGVCYVDLDGFKSINDGLGHDVGDQILIRVANRLRATLTAPGNLLARLGGDEFGIVTVGSRGGVPGEQAARVLAALRRPIRIGHRDLTVSASVGVVDASSTETDVRSLMRAADISLYQAKARGRGRVALHDPRADAHHVTRHALATELVAALARGEFFLEYQPLVSLADGTIHRVEALLRWRHPVRGVIQPDHFIEMAEESGHISSLGRWVLTTACRAAFEWYTRFPSAQIGINVNVAVSQLQDPELPAHVAATLETTGLPTELLYLELTESAVLDEATGPIEALDKLAAAGIRLVIDDFGTGYSNLAYLTRLPVSELKIPASFVAAAENATVRHRILPAIISLAHSIDLAVTAEGVETTEQVELLRSLHCDTVQGWYYGAPMSAAEIAELVAADLDRRPGDR